MKYAPEEQSRPQVKVCAVCRKSQPASAFHFSAYTKSALASRCKHCQKVRDAARYPLRYKEIRRPQLLQAYGLDDRRYEEMYREQNGRCAICGRVDERRLSVDHDHHTNTLRRLLCRQCNLGLGYFHDNPELLRGAANYLESFSPPAPKY